MRSLYVFGTGHALVTKRYNSSFAIREDESFFVLDTGGGNGILSAMEAMDVDYSQLRFMFISHSHTDHILGAIWIIRAIGQAINDGKYKGEFKIYSHADLIKDLRALCDITQAQKIKVLFDSNIIFEVVGDGQTETFPFGNVQFFDTGCELIPQFGCKINYKDGSSLVYLGDDPVRRQSEPYVFECDWFVAEALCMESERHIHHPEESFHSSVKEAASNAEALRVKNLVLCHTEDTHGNDKKALYIAEATEFFSGNIFVPDDREIICII